MALKPGHSTSRTSSHSVNQAGFTCEGDGALEASPAESLTHTRAPARDTMREQLRDAVPDLAPAMVDSFTRSMEATKKLRIHEPCEKCGCKHVRYVEAPDFMERARAIDLLTTNTEGRAGVAEELSQSPQVTRIIGRTHS